MENNLENQSRFYAQYWGQTVLTCPHWNNAFLVEYYFLAKGFDEFVAKEGANGWCIDDDHLLLKSLSSISDDDGIWIAKQIGLANAVVSKRNAYSLEITDDSYRIVFLGGEYNQVHVYKNDYAYWPDNISVIDLVRAKGYALPWMGLSVEKLIEYGWIKLISDDRKS